MIVQQKYNYKAFIPEEVKAGAVEDLLNYLLDYNKKSTEYYYDIHITTDGYCTIVEWADRSYDSSLPSGSFKYVDYDETIMKEVIMPDNSSVYISQDEDEDDYIKEWYEDHPEYSNDDDECDLCKLQIYDDAADDDGDDDNNSSKETK